jgi:hypothetical protein
VKKHAAPFRWSALAGTAALASGCDPALNVWGAYFPAWVACLAGGVAATALLRSAFARLQLEAHLGPLLLIYPALLALSTLLFWIVFFQG